MTTKKNTKQIINFSFEICSIDSQTHKQNAQTHKHFLFFIFLQINSYIYTHFNGFIALCAMLACQDSLASQSLQVVVVIIILAYTIDFIDSFRCCTFWVLAVFQFAPLHYSLHYALSQSLCICYFTASFLNCFTSFTYI